MRRPIRHPDKKGPQRQTPAVRAESAQFLFRVFIIIPPEFQVKCRSEAPGRSARERTRERPLVVFKLAKEADLGKVYEIFYTFLSMFAHGTATEILAGVVAGTEIRQQLIPATQSCQPRRRKLQSPRSRPFPSENRSVLLPRQRSGMRLSGRAISYQSQRSPWSNPEHCSLSNPRAGTDQY